MANADKPSGAGLANVRGRKRLQSSLVFLYTITSLIFSSRGFAYLRISFWRMPISEDDGRLLELIARSASVRRISSKLRI